MLELQIFCLKFTRMLCKNIKFYCKIATRVYFEFPQQFMQKRSHYHSLLSKQIFPQRISIVSRVAFSVNRLYAFLSSILSIHPRRICLRQSNVSSRPLGLRWLSGRPFVKFVNRARVLAAARDKRLACVPLENARNRECQTADGVYPESPSGVPSQDSRPFARALGDWCMRSVRARRGGSLESSIGSPPRDRPKISSHDRLVWKPSG